MKLFLVMSSTSGVFLIERESSRRSLWQANHAISPKQNILSESKSKKNLATCNPIVSIKIFLLQNFTHGHPIIDYLNHVLSLNSVWISGI